MDVLELIKNRRTIRRYQNKPIPGEIVDKIVEAGIWGPSLLGPGFQPWVFVLIDDLVVIRQVGDIMFAKSRKMGILGSRILRLSAYTLSNAPCIIAVYNSSSLVGFAQKISTMLVKYAKAAELAAISATIQNMLLTAESLGIGSNWLDTPLFCEKEINRFLGMESSLIAVLTFGYPAEKGRRSLRKPFSEAMRYL